MKRRIRIHAYALLLVMIIEIVAPTTMLAITGHDSMPEYTSFEPVGTSNLVNLSDGSFTYNIPLIEIPNGYPLSLSYHSSEVNNEALASWVGLGWTLNPGTVTRMKRGFPDEFDGTQSVKYWNRMEPNWTAAVDAGVNLELFGDEGLVDLNLGASLNYNNYNGIGSSVNAGIGIAGVTNLGFGLTNGQPGFSANINPMGLLSQAKKGFKREKGKTQKAEMSKQDEEEIEKLAKMPRKERKAITQAANNKSNSVGDSNPIGFSASAGGIGYSRGSSFSGSINSRKTIYPVSLARYHGYMARVQVDVGLNLLPIPMSPEVTLAGSFSKQTNFPSDDINVVGYEHSEKALGDANKSKMMDYETEKESIFEKRQNTLGYPVPNNDVYNMSGEAMGGSFRSFRSEFGHYRKNFIKSEDFSVEIGADVDIPLNPTLPPIVVNGEFSFGVNAGGAYHWTTVGGWKEDNLPSNYKFTSSAPESEEKSFYRFAGDPAGYFQHKSIASSDQEFRAALNPGFLTASANLGGWNSVHQGFSKADFRRRNSTPGDKNKHRSTYIEKHSLAEFDEVVTSDDIPFKVYEKVTPVLDNGMVEEYDHSAYSAGVHTAGEIVTHNADGLTYVYGLPVYSRGEKQLQYSYEGSLDPTSNELLTVSPTGISDGNTKRKLGYESDALYPTTHLITQILSPDYIDRTGNGPSPDDFGSYTKFNYERVHGGTGGSQDWYTFKTPYEGMSFDFGSLSSDKDDMASFSSGQKEVYYLHSVSSKTHTAFFTTSDDRDDGKSHGSNNSINGLISDAGGNEKSLLKLSRIDLYSIVDCDLPSSLGGEDVGFYQIPTGPNAALPLKTVHFKYANDDTGVWESLCPGVPNSTDGKLTLKKVWFEYGGKLTSKISPYEFEYEYPGLGVYSDEYAGTEANGGIEIDNSPLEENPLYEPFNSDRWGNYRDYGHMSSGGQLHDLARFWPFVHQNPSPDFDPAAWCLKQIKLPSGGEIHVQYEQSDYHFVQDQVSNVMVPLKSNTDGHEGDALNGKKYYLDLAKIGIVSLPSDMNNFCKQVFEPMIVDKKRTYFSFLYSLVQNQEPTYSAYDAEFLDGFARIDGYGWDGNGVYFCFKDGGGSNWHSIDYGSNASQREIPRKICKNFYKTQRRGQLDGSANALDGNQSEQSVVESLVGVFSNMVAGLDGVCKYMNPEMSSIRIQMPHMKSKLGGGVRVKRVLMFDDGDLYSEFGGDDPKALYGQEYSYTTEIEHQGVLQTISSGVAANEPTTGYRECALVHPVDKDAQSGLSALIYGRDMYSQEGPFGEAFLPGPSITYSTVTVESIHKGTTGTGKEVHEFYTTKDFPFESEKTDVQHLFETPITLSGGYGGVSISYERRSPVLAQGYIFKNHSMAGKPKKVSKYGQGGTAPIAYEQYEYFNLGDQVKVMGKDMVQYAMPYEALGKESEILAESRKVNDYAVNATVGIDYSGPGAVALIGPLPIPLPGLFGTDVNVSAGLSENIYSTHVVTQNVTYPALLKRTISHADGVTRYTENKVFDDNTGTAVVTESWDDFEGKYINQSIMASWNYENMESKYKNTGIRIVSSTLPGQTELRINSDASGDYIEFIAEGGCGDLAKFVRGDYLLLKEYDSSDGLYSGNEMLVHVDKVDYGLSRLYLQTSQFNDGSIAYGEEISMEVLKSGYTNQLNAKAGNIVYHFTNLESASYFSDDGLPASNNLTDDLNAALGGLVPSSGTGTLFSLDGTYCMDISGYAGNIGTCLNSLDLNQAEVSNLQLLAGISNGELTISLLSFVLYDCQLNAIDVTCQTP